MKIWPSALFGIALGLGAVAPAGAADLGSGEWSMKDGPQSMPLQARWYLRGDLGYAFHDDPDMIEDGVFTASETSIDDTWTIGGGIGLYFSSNLRGDVTVDYRNDAEVSGTLDDSAIGPGSRTFDLSSTVVLANLYYDFNRNSGFTPYVGAGIGWTNNQTHDGLATDLCGCTFTIAGATESDMAAALMVGASIDLSGDRGGYSGSIKDGNIATPSERGLMLDVGYRFLYLGDASTGEVLDSYAVPVADDPVIEDIHAHEFRVGLRYDIW